MFQLSNLPIKFQNNFPFAWIGIFYVLMALLYFFPTYYLFQFANKTKKGISNNSNESVEEGLVNLKSMFKFIGIFTVVILSIYALIFLVAVSLCYAIGYFLATIKFLLIKILNT